MVPKGTYLVFQLTFQSECMGGAWPHFAIWSITWL